MSGPDTLVLVDGEHYPPVVRDAIAALTGRSVVAAALLGGTEKVAGEPDYGVPLVTGATPLEALRAGLERFRPAVVHDLSDQPVLDARARLLLAAHTVAAGARYEGADFAFDPPPRPRLSTKPSVAVTGTGKRTGKTAVAGHLARLLAARGTPPVVVAMGRGGPAQPELVDPTGTDLTAEGLLALAAQGRHAASDHLEDALTSGVVTIGTRRAGGGMAGAPGPNTFALGVEMANARPETFTVFEGSGAAAPPVHADATVLVVPATADPELVTGYLGVAALLMADLVVVTLAPEPLPRAAHALEDRIREHVPQVPLVRTTFQPRPLGPVSGRSIFFTTTAPPGAAAQQAAHLEAAHGARVVGVSSNLANRTLLSEDLQAAAGAEVLVTELKAAAVDVAGRVALDAGMQVVFCDNQPVGTGGDGPLDELLLACVRRAEERFHAPNSTHRHL